MTLVERFLCQLAALCLITTNAYPMDGMHSNLWEQPLFDNGSVVNIQQDGHTIPIPVGQRVTALIENIVSDLRALHTVIDERFALFDKNLKQEKLQEKTGAEFARLCMPGSDFRKKYEHTLGGCGPVFEGYLAAQYVRDRLMRRAAFSRGDELFMREYLALQKPEVLQEIATALVMQSSLYGQLKQFSQYAGIATLLGAQLAPDAPDMTAYSPVDPHALALANKLCTLFMPNPRVKISVEERPELVATLLNISHVMRFNKLHSTHITDSIERLEVIPGQTNPLVRSFITNGMRACYLEKSYAQTLGLANFLNAFYGFCVFDPAAFLQRTSAELPYTGTHGSISRQVQEIAFMEKMATTCSLNYQGRLVDKTIRDMSSIAQLFSGHGSSLLCAPELPKLLELANAVARNFLIVAPPLESDFIKKYYATAADSMLRPKQILIEKELAAFCGTFEQKMELYNALYNMVYEALEAALPKPKKIKDFQERKKFFTLKDWCFVRVLGRHDGTGNLPQALQWDTAEVLLPSIVRAHTQQQEPLPALLILEKQAMPAPAASSSAGRKKKERKKPAIVAPTAALTQKPESAGKAELFIAAPAASVTTAEQATVTKDLSLALAPQSTQHPPTAAPVQADQTIACKPSLPAQHQEKVQAAVAASVHEQATVGQEVPTAAPKVAAAQQHKKTACAMRPVDTRRLTKWRIADRVRNWFDAAFCADKTPKDVLYHTFTLQADKFIRLHGLIHKQPNATRKGHYDTVYRLPGQIFYRGGAKTYAIFNCSIDTDHICYHRGITLVSGDSLGNEFGLWPLERQGLEEAAYKVHEGLDLGALENQGTILQQTESFVVMRDTYNDVTIVLFLLASLGDD